MFSRETFDFDTLSVQLSIPQISTPFFKCQKNLQLFVLDFNKFEINLKRIIKSKFPLPMCLFVLISKIKKLLFQTVWLIDFFVHIHKFVSKMVLQLNFENFEHYAIKLRKICKTLPANMI